MKSENQIKEKSYAFAVRIVNVYKHLINTKREFVISKQLLRCGTSIGANIHEAIRAYSRADFAAKLSISLKEASETEYWIMLLQDTEFLTPKQAESLLDDVRELIKLLISIIKTLRQNTDPKN